MHTISDDNMTSIKLISTIFIWSQLALFACCFTKSTTSNSNYTYNSDTTYISSTRQLKSDKMPESVFLMKNLRHLSITGMDCDVGDHSNCWMLKVLDTKIINLKNLATLSLTLNAIQKIPNELAELKNLKFIDLTDNSGLSNITTLTKIKSLEYLYLYGCGLTKLPDNIGDLTNLKEIGLVGNHIDKTEQGRIKKVLPNCNIIF